jgi:hypothetical protein
MKIFHRPSSLRYAFKFLDNQYFMIQVRQQFKADTQFFLGKKTLMSFALGREKEEEV